MSQNLRVAELDFDQIKTNLVAFLKSKPEFTDYEFTGSGLNVIIDLLSYNTHYNGVITNMLASEAFLDSAIKRETVSMHAKRLGYLPRSARSAYATINLEVFPTGYPGTLTIGRGAVFNAVLPGNLTVQFITRDAKTVQVDSNSRYIFQNLKIFEGSLQTFRYAVDLSLSLQKFQIPTSAFDATTLRVFVQKSASNTSTMEYSYCQDVSLTDPSSLVYYLKTNDLGFYEVYFGDGVLGKAIEDGNIIILEYIVTNKTIGNGISKFYFTDSIEGNTNVLVSTVTSAIGGAEPETIEQIKENAQKSVLAQNRAVTNVDYKSVIQKLFPVDSITVWGGEDNIPPVYGKVFISVKLPGSNSVLTPAQKDIIKTQLKTKKILGIQPELVDPNFLYCSIETTVNYDSTKSSNGVETIRTKVLQQIKNYVLTTLNKFEQKLLYSGLVSTIDATDPSILSNITLVKVKKIIVPSINTAKHYLIDFQNPIVPGTILSTPFMVDGATNSVYLEDDSLGNLNLTYNLAGTKTIWAASVGTVDYITGACNVTQMIVTSYTGVSLDIKCVPVSLNVEPKRSTIITVLDADISIGITSV